MRLPRADGRHVVLPLRYLSPKERAEFLERATTELADKPTVERSAP